MSVEQGGLKRITDLHERLAAAEEEVASLWQELSRAIVDHNSADAFLCRAVEVIESMATLSAHAKLLTDVSLVTEWAQIDRDADSVLEAIQAERAKLACAK